MPRPSRSGRAARWRRPPPCARPSSAAGSRSSCVSTAACSACDHGGGGAEVHLGHEGADGVGVAGPLHPAEPRAAARPSSASKSLTWSTAPPGAGGQPTLTAPPGPGGARRRRRRFTERQHDPLTSRGPPTKLRRTQDDEGDGSLRYYTADRLLTGEHGEVVAGGGVLVDGASITWVGADADLPADLGPRPRRCPSATPPCCPVSSRATCTSASTAGRRRWRG